MINQIKHITEIDTVALQIDCDTPIKQRGRLDLLLRWIGNNQVATVSFDKVNKQYKLFYARTTLATINTGFSHSKYYIHIRFAGLKRYNTLIDQASKKCLMTICALLNTSNITFNLQELDIAIDTFCPFNNILVLCTKKSPNVQYHGLGTVQYFNDTPTSYIELLDTKAQVKNTSLRAYIYDKSAKERLPYPLTRFELKLQNRYFNRAGFDVQSILNALSRYHLLYFNNLRDKQNIITRYSKYENVYKREINRLGLDSYRLYPTASVILKFIQDLRTVYVDFRGKVSFR